MNATHVIPLPDSTALNIKGHHWSVPSDLLTLVVAVGALHGEETVIGS